MARIPASRIGTGRMTIDDIFPSAPTTPARELLRLAQAAQAEQVNQGAPPPVSPPMGLEGNAFAWLDQWMDLVGRELKLAVQAIPSLPSELAASIGQSVEVAGGIDAMIQLAFAVALAGVVVFAFRMWTAGTRDGGLEQVACRAGASRLLMWDAIDRVLFAVLLMTAGRVMMEGWGPGGGLPAACGKAAIRFYGIMLIAQVVLRPYRPRFRLIPVTDGVSRRIFVLTGIAALISVSGPSVIPVLVRNGMDWPAAAGLAVMLLMICAGLAAAAVKLAADGMTRVVGTAGRNLVLLVGLLLVTALYVTWGVSILLRQFQVFNAVLFTVGTLGAYGMIDATLGLEAGRGKQSRAHMIRRIFRFGGMMVIVYVTGSLWMSADGVVPSAMWPGLKLALIYGGGTAFAGFVAWEVTDYWAARAIGTAPRIDPLGGGDDENEPAPASRLATFFPMARVIAAIVIVLMATLLALSNLGVNIAPLLAGAGVFGLALSFGSQSLIRDILSGVFFLGDDAFRVGEYIDTGRLKGTVEQISLRSLRLRHQNGQVHTIPYGQLQQITNFSRDWATMKFNLRVEPTVDLEHVRKTVKKLGLAMMEDPELAREIIQPLKLQGVADIQDNALLIRLKFTARPGRPTWVQREALKRIYGAFREQGIPFASNAVTVREGEHAPVPAPAGPPTVVRPSAFNPAFGAAAGAATAAAGAAVAANAAAAAER